MPRPPDIPDLDKVNFITAYMTNLCVPPFYVFCEFAKEPAGNVVLLLLGLDYQDMLKDWLRPGRGRSRNPARHGRKRPFQRVSMDPNDYFGSKARALAPEYPGIKLPGARAIFYLTDQIDRLNFTAAIVEGVTDVGFAGLLGVIQADPSNCPGLPYVNREAPSPVPVPGFLPTSTPIEANTLLGANLFPNTGPFAYQTFASRWTLGYSGKVVSLSLGGTNDWRPAIYSTTRGVIAEGSAANLDQGGEQWVSVAGQLEPGEVAFPARTAVSGSVDIEQFKVFAFGGGLW